MYKLMTVFFACLLTLSTAVGKTETPQMHPKLAFLAPYLGTWQATFESGAVDVSKWERALNGTAVRTLHSINNGEYGGESLIFWDNKKKSLVFYYFTTAGFYTQGIINQSSDGDFVAIEEVTGNKDGITKVKSTSTLLKNSMKVSSSYLKYGKWTEPEARTYTRSSKEVIFR